jgi:aryl-alcohol dehydrogenase-like predicted oxidoreductase
VENIKLKNSDITVSRLCFGGCPMGGYGWGDVEENDFINAVHSALDEGVNFFDTADTYGLGQSEKTLGKALKDRRIEAIVATKFGVRVENGKTFYDNSAEWIKIALEKSLKRLGTDYIDLYQIHYRDGKTPIGEVINTLTKLEEKGLIRYFGLSNISVCDAKEIKPYADELVSFQNEYSLACRKNETGIFELSEKLSLTPFTWGSLGQGVLTGKYSKNEMFENNDRRYKDVYVNFHGEKLDKNLKIVDVMRKIATETGHSLPAIAIRFIMDYIKNSVVITGIKTSAQLKSNTDAMNWSLSETQLNSLLRVSS